MSAAPLALRALTDSTLAPLPETVAMTGLELPPDLPYERWLALGQTLLRIERGILWWLGDWWRYGVETRRYGAMAKPDAKALIQEATGYTYKTIANAAAVAASFEFSRRRENLPFTHHAEVAALPPEDADALLDEVARTGLASRDLRERVVDRRRELRIAALRALPPSVLTRHDARIDVADATVLPLDDESVDLIVTSPPYGVGIKYADGSDVPPEEWPTWMALWLEEALRVMKPYGRLALNVPLDCSTPFARPTYIQAGGAALAVGDAARKKGHLGWEYASSVDWHEDNSTKGGWANGSQSSAAKPHHISRIEHIAIFSKGPMGPSSDNDDDITSDEFLLAGRGPWTFSGESRAWEGHPAAFPLELPRRLIPYLCRVGDVVLDPFVGSGTTLVAALERGRRAIGFDRSPTYVESSKRRLVDAGLAT